MAQRHQKHPTSHPYIDTIWTTQNLTDGVYTATPDGSWDLISCRNEDGSRFAFFAGQATKPQQVPYKAHTSSLVISFAAHVYLTDIKARRLTDTTIMLTNADADHFLLSGVKFAFPTVDTAEELVDALIAHGHIQSDEVVENAEKYAASQRTIQRHFSQSAGMTKKQLEQVKQAQRAVRLLKNGLNPATVAAEVGYHDQAHMSRSLRRIMGTTPGDVDAVHKL